MRVIIIEVFEKGTVEFIEFYNLMPYKQKCAASAHVLGIAHKRIREVFAQNICYMRNCRFEHMSNRERNKIERAVEHCRFV